MQSKLKHAADDPKKMFAVVNQLLSKGRAPPVQPDLDDKSSAESLYVFFAEKIEEIRESLSTAVALAASPVEPAPLSGQFLPQSVPVTKETLSRLIKKKNQRKLIQ